MVIEYIISVVTTAEYRVAPRPILMAAQVPEFFSYLRL